MSKDQASVATDRNWEAKLKVVDNARERLRLAGARVEMTCSGSHDIMVRTWQARVPLELNTNPNMRKEDCCIR